MNLVSACKVFVKDTSLFAEPRFVPSPILGTLKGYKVQITTFQYMAYTKRSLTQWYFDTRSLLTAECCILKSI